jgi:hypothetical protein
MKEANDLIKKFKNYSTQSNLCAMIAQILVIKKLKEYSVISEKENLILKELQELQYFLFLNEYATVSRKYKNTENEIDYLIFRFGLDENYATQLVLKWENNLKLLNEL